MSEGWRQWQGRTVNNQYPLQNFLGGSDHSAVFLTVATDGSKAAIKLTAPPASSFDAQIARWQEISSLNDPRLIRILDAGKCDLDGVRMLYVVMEYADENLGQVLSDRALTPDEARATLPSVLDGLDFVHGKGYIHTRIKPTNILAIGDRVKLSSDSLVRPSNAVVDARASASSYDPPEVRTARPSTATDIWQFGVTLVEALTQRRPTPGQSGQSFSGSVPDQFRELVHNCLQLDPARRWTIDQVRRGMSGSAAVANRPAPVQNKVAPVPIRPVPTTVPMAPPTQRAPIAQDRTQPGIATNRADATKSSRWPMWAAIAAVVVIALFLLGRSRRSAQPSGAAVSESQAGPARGAAPEATNGESARIAAGSAAAGPAATNGSSASLAARTRPSATRSALPPAGGTASDAEAGVVQRVMPQVSPSALRTVHGTLKVRIRVDVDGAGNVSNATFESPGPSKYFSRLSMDAARGWKFSPNQTGNRTVKILFAFTRGGTQASATQ